MTDDAFDYDLLARYLAGECTEAEAAAVRRWLDASPEHRREVELIDCAWQTAAGLPSSDRLAAMWGNVATALELPAAAVAEQGRPVVRESVRQRRWRVPAWAVAVAATVVLAVGATAVWRSARTERGAGEVALEAGFREFRTPRGQRGVMTFLDRTRVVLGPDSRLRARIAEAGPREVVLEGEAVFDVVHDTTRPFVVRAGTAVTEDLGTRFGVRAYAGEAVRVVVSEGAVAVRDTAAGGAAVLGPRDLAEVGGSDGSDGVAVERGVDPDRYLGWTDGRLTFRRAALAEVAAQLERWFDVRIVVADSALLAARVNASFEDDDIDEVLRTLAGALDARVERRGPWVYFRSRS